MATSASVKKPAPDNVSDISAARARNSKVWLWLALAAVIFLAGAGGAWFWWSHNAAPVSKAAPPPPPKPVFVELGSFTVNLAADRVLQTSLTIQVKGSDEAEQIKLYMPQVKSRLLLLMSAKNADELNTAKGKEALAADIAALLRQPFTKGLAPMSLAGVFFTAFVIQ